MASQLPRLTRVAHAWGLASLEGASVAYGVWTLRAHDWMPPFARDNKIGAADRLRELASIGSGVLFASAIAIGLLMWHREGLDVVERATRRCLPLALVGAAAVLLDWRLWSGREAVFYTLLLAAGFALQGALLVARRTAPVFALERQLAALRAAWVSAKRRLPSNADLPLLSVLAGAGIYAVYFSAITVENHHNLGTSIDLAIENNLMWNLSHGGPLFWSSPFSGPAGSHLGHHATFFAYVLAPLYLLAPRPETLLVVQATLLGSAAIPLFLYARRHVGPWIAAVVAWAYLVYPPLHGSNLYDFHYLPLGIPFLWWVVYALDSGRRWMALVAALLALSIREDIAGSLAVFGIFFVLTGTAAVEGAALTVVAGVYAVVLKLAIMPRYKDGVESFVNQYEGLLPEGGSGFGGVLETIVGNPPFVANVLIDRDKVAYVLQILAPLMALPLRARLAWLLLGPGVAFTLLSTGYSPLIQISFQYTAYWTAFAFVGVVLALERLAGREAAAGSSEVLRQRIAVAALVVASLTATLYQGAFTRHDTVRGGFGPFHFGTTAADLSKREHLAHLIARLPPDGLVAASENLVAQVSSRSNDYKLRYDTWDANYLLFEIPVGSDEARHVLPLLRNGTFGVVADEGDMALARRGQATDGNDALLKRIGR
jgi:uncharacterized membrane protein